MSDIALPSYSDVAAEALQLRLAMDPSELHGTLCGFLSGGTPLARDTWLGEIMVEPGLGAKIDSVQTNDALDRLFQATEQQLESPDFGFELLLPEQLLSVIDRGDSLLNWCRGFLGGFGLSAGANPPLSEDSQDALSDLARIAAADLSYDDVETDEQDLEEISEFVRIAVLLMHSDCVLAPRRRRTLN